jgi:hypothetical protein
MGFNPGFLHKLFITNAHAENSARVTSNLNSIRNIKFRNIPYASLDKPPTYLYLSWKSQSQLFRRLKQEDLEAGRSI